MPGGDIGGLDLGPSGTYGFGCQSGAGPAEPDPAEPEPAPEPAAGGTVGNGAEPDPEPDPAPGTVGIGGFAPGTVGIGCATAAVATPIATDTKANRNTPRVWHARGAASRAAAHPQTRHANRT